VYSIFSDENLLKTYNVIDPVIFVNFDDENLKLYNDRFKNIITASI